MYEALVTCCPNGGAPLTYVRLYEQTVNGLGAWQKLNYSFQPALPTNDEKDREEIKGNLKEVTGAQLPAALAEFEFAMGQWEAQYGQLFEEQEKRAALFKLVPREDPV